MVRYLVGVGVRKVRAGRGYRFRDPLFHFGSISGSPAVLLSGVAGAAPAHCCYSAQASCEQNQGGGFGGYVNVCGVERAYRGAAHLERRVARLLPRVIEPQQDVAGLVQLKVGLGGSATQIRLASDRYVRRANLVIYEVPLLEAGPHERR